jgi:hypothetical protein
MPTKRQRKTHGTTQRVTPLAVELFHAGDLLGLMRELHMYPWECSPLWATTPQPQGYHTPGTGCSRTWRQAWELRQEILRAKAS